MNKILIAYAALIFGINASLGFSAEIKRNIDTSPAYHPDGGVLIQKIIDLRGPIVDGDYANLREALNNNSLDLRNLQKRYEEKRISFHTILYLSSGGGSVSEAAKISEEVARIDREGPLQVAVKGVCASACTMILFSAKFRAARQCDLIGVHRASILSAENEDTFDTSAMIADFLMKRGVDWSVVKKMLMTRASQVAWLTRDDMQRANLHLLDVPCR